MERFQGHRGRFRSAANPGVQAVDLSQFIDGQLEVEHVEVRGDPFGQNPYSLIVRGSTYPQRKPSSVWAIVQSGVTHEELVE